LAKALRIDDLLDQQDSIPLDPEFVSEEEREGYTWSEYTIRSTPGRRIPVVLTRPQAEGKFPAVVCIHGHSGDRYTTYDCKSVYKGFGTALAPNAVTIGMDVGQHEVYEEGRTLMGERLWDTMRCVDFIAATPEVDPNRIGCAGLSLGGEMAMWLGAMDRRIAATVSAGYLTTMDHMEVNHCMCWKFPGLRELVEWTDIYALIAPRPLMCQNGRKEPYKDFTVGIARPAMAEIRRAYAAFDAEDAAVLAVHDGAHEVDLPALIAFFEQHLGA
jgi:dienelactone hydrolase